MRVEGFVHLHDGEDDSAVFFQVVKAAVAPDADLGRIGSFDEGM